MKKTAEELEKEHDFLADRVMHVCERISRLEADSPEKHAGSIFSGVMGQCWAGAVARILIENEIFQQDEFSEMLNLAIRAWLTKPEAKHRQNDLN